MGQARGVGRTRPVQEAIRMISRRPVSGRCTRHLPRRCQSTIARTSERRCPAALCPANLRISSARDQPSAGAIFGGHTAELVETSRQRQSPFGCEGRNLQVLSATRRRRAMEGAVGRHLGGTVLCL